MSLTKVQTISNAVTLLGNKPILSLDGQGDLVAAAEQAYDFLANQAMSTGFWRFCTKIAQLPLVNETPIVTQWRYIYQLPGDYLKMVRQYPQNYAYEIYEGGKMYSNLVGPIYIEYVHAVEPTAFPDYFSTYLIYEIALYLALSNANSAQFVSALTPARDWRLAQAQANDAQNRPQSWLASQPIIANRGVTTWATG